jgi:hypothetical protein
LSQLQTYFNFRIFNSNSIGNLNFFTQGKLFLLNLSITLQSLEIFRAMEVLFPYFTVWISLI